MYMSNVYIIYCIGIVMSFIFLMYIDKDCGHMKQTGNFLFGILLCLIWPVCIIMLILSAISDVLEIK